MKDYVATNLTNPNMQCSSLPLTKLCSLLFQIRVKGRYT